MSDVVATVPAGTDAGPAPARPVDRLRRWLPWVVIGSVLLLFGIVGQPSSRGGALDPNGTGPEGAKALVLLLRHYGAVVTVDSGVPDRGVTAAVVLHDGMDSARRRQVAAWVRAGGRLIVADPGSELEPGAPTPADTGILAQDLVVGGPCPALGLDDVDRLAVGRSLLLRAPPVGATTCFNAALDDGETGSFVVVTAAGNGTVVGLGGAGVWINARLDKDENSALAVDLLTAGTNPRVDILTASRAGSGSQSVLALLDPRLKWAVLQLAVAFGALAWWRGRRLGRPVPEEDPVQIAGSEIVSAVGDLMARTASRDAAAHQLRDSARAWAGQRVGVGSTASPAHVAAAVAAGIGVDAGPVLALLTDAPVPDDTALVRLAQSLAHFRQEIAGGGTQAVH
ncbi:MAG TPA: DUF4350 domain-containing protein [Acidimicrobiales bacterium]